MRPAAYCAEDSLRGLRFTSPPFLRGEKAHAGAEALVVAGSLARILQRRVVGGAMPARAHLTSLFRSSPHSAAAYCHHRFSIF
jgi:hypothetical protein